MAWTIRALGHPVDGEPVRWQGSLSSKVLPHGVLACRAGVLNLLSDGVGAGIRQWAAVGAITQTRVRRKPITVAYADVEVPERLAAVETASNRTVFDLLVKMTDPGRAVAELEALAREGRLGRGAISTLLDLSRNHPTPSIDQLLAEIQAHRIV